MFSLSAVTTLLFLYLAALTPVSAIWPAPNSFHKGNTTLYLHQNLRVTYNGGFVCWSNPPNHPDYPHFPDGPCPREGIIAENGLYQQLPYTSGFVPSDSFDSKQIVQAAVSRTLDSILSSEFVPWMLHKRNRLSDFEPSILKGQRWVETLQISQTAADTKNTFKPAGTSTDESYNLTLTEAGEAKITAVTSVGVLRGLETFSQLFYRHSGGPFWYTPYAPVDIQDAPKFPHRGILIDVARNWLPVEDILRTIDAMSWSKLNRLHIHITDSQSWPLEVPAMPDLAEKGAYRPDHTYSPAEVEHVHKYAVHRGVEVILEIDMPGHIGSVALSRPDLIVAYNEYPYTWYCAEQPCGAFKLNEPKVDEFLGTLFDDLLPRVAPYSAYFHTGGDELNANDSMLDPGVNSNSTEVLRPLLQKFIDNQHRRVRAAGLTPMVWEEIPLDWAVNVGNDTVVQTWLGGDSVKNLTSRGLQIIDSNYNLWYLDCGRGQWQTFDNGLAFETYFPFDDWCSPAKGWGLVYSHDPTAGLTPEQAKRVLGGEVAAWSESIDSVNLDVVLWPRSSAAGEVLWSGRQDASGQNRSQLDAAPRLAELRERMVDRGVRAAPISMTFCTQGDPIECAYPV